MKKIASVVAALFSVVVLSASCFAQEKNQTKAPAKVVKEIVKQMIEDKELSDMCINEARGNANKMIKLTRKDFGPSIEAFVVTGVGICCMSSKRCAMWVYKKNSNGTFSKAYGVDSPDNIIPQPKELHNNGMYNIEVTNSFEQKNAFYEFDGNQYKFVREEYYGK